MRLMKRQQDDPSVQRKQKREMTYFKLHLWRLLFMVLSETLVICLYFLLFEFTTYQELTSAYFLFAFSWILIVDGAVILIFKKDLFGDKYKGTVSYVAFILCLYFDFIVGTPMFIASIVVAIDKGIGYK